MSESTHSELFNADRLRNNCSEKQQKQLIIDRSCNHDISKQIFTTYYFINLRPSLTHVNFKVRKNPMKMSENGDGSDYTGE